MPPGRRPSVDPTTSDFVGRIRLLDELRSVVDASLAGRGSVVLLSGEPGIGKSRLAAELAAYASVAGAEVHRGGGWELGSPSYWPWVQVLRSCAQTHPAVHERLGVGAPELVRLIPELAAAVGADERGGDQPRFRLFDSIASYLRRVAVDRPVVLVLDDLHEADVGSLVLLRFVARECLASALLVVGCYRDLEVDRSSEMGRALASLELHHGVVSLDGLEEPAVRDLLARLVGPHEAERLFREVHERSGGNPLFVHELGRLLVGARGHQLAESQRIPHTVRSLVHRRVGALADGTRSVLSMAAVLGQDFDLRLLQQIRSEPPAVLAALDDAMSARLVRQLDAAALRFGFVHAIVRETLYDTLPLAERADLHRRTAEQLEARDAPPAELAHHYLRAAPVIGTAAGARFSVLAGRQALELLAYEDAARHLTEALRAGEYTQQERAQLWVDVGRALDLAGRPQDARPAFEQAAALARAAQDPRALAQAALGVGAGLEGFETRLLDPSQIDLLSDALDAVGTSDLVLRARLLARLAVALTFSASDDQRLMLADEAVATARHSGDDDALAFSLAAHCDAVAEPQHAPQRRDEAAEMVALAHGRSHRSLELLARRHLLVAHLELGDVASADADIETFERTAGALRQPVYGGYVALWRAMRALMDGRLDECRACLDEAAELGEQSGSENLHLLVRMTRHWLLVEEGRVTEAVQVVREEIELVGGAWGQSQWAALIAPALFPSEARATLDRLVAGDFAELPRDANWLGALTGWVVDACRITGHAPAGARVYELLAPHADRFAVEGIAAICHGSVARHLGVLAAILGRRDAASAHFKTALAANRKAGAALLVARTQEAYGDTLVDTRDRDSGEAMLREAAAALAEVGAAARPSALAPAPARSSVSSSINVFRRDGEVWTLSYAGTTARLKDAKGLHDIAALLTRQGAEVHVLDLLGSFASGGGSAQELLDSTAISRYRARVAELREEIDEAETFADLARAERAHAEMDVLTAELTAAAGLGARPRGFTDHVERARKAVSQRVRNTIKRLDTEHPALGRHLDASLRMGVFCSYLPERPVDWTL